MPPAPDPAAAMRTPSGTVSPAADDGRVSLSPPTPARSPQGPVPQPYPAHSGPSPPRSNAEATPCGSPPGWLPGVCTPPRSDGSSASHPRVLTATEPAPERGKERGGPRPQLLRRILPASDESAVLSESAGESPRSRTAQRPPSPASELSWGGGAEARSEGRLIDHPDTLDLGDVVLNNKHYFCRFPLTNLSPEPIRVQIESNVPTLGFQQSNANFHSMVGNVPLVGSNEVEKAPGSGERPPELFNQVFNYVNLIRNLEIKPRAVEEVIVSYRATAGKQAQKAQPIKTKKEGEVVLVAHDPSGRTERRRIPFSCMCCASEMVVEPDSLDFGAVNMESCNVLQLNVRNRSPIPLFYIMRLGHTSAALSYQLTDYDTQEGMLDRELRLEENSYQTVQVRVIPKADAAGQHDMLLHVENLLDETTQTVTISANISGAQAEKPPLAVSLPIGASCLDFGNCYAGVRVSRTFDVTNECVHPLVVSCAADSRDSVPGVVACRIKDHSDAPPSGEKAGESSDEGDDAGMGTPTAPPADRPAARGDGNAGALLPPGMAETVIKPGRRERIEVYFIPDPTDRVLGRAQERPGCGDSLQPVRFRLFVSAGDTAESAREKARLVSSDGKKEKKAEVKDSDGMTYGTTYSKAVQCRAAVCTSRVEVRETELNFGDSVVGEKSTCTLQLNNPCELPAQVRLDFDSRVMSLTQDSRDCEIAPRAEAKVIFEMVPHMVNPSFRKQVTIRNLNNPRDNTIINLSSNNIESTHKSSNTFHSTYYHVSFPQSQRRRQGDGADGKGESAAAAHAAPLVEGAKERRKELLPFRHGICMDNVVTGFPTLRSFRLKNVHDSELVVDLAVSRSEWLSLYVAGQDRVDTPAVRALMENEQGSPLAQGGGAEGAEALAQPPWGQVLGQLIRLYEADPHLHAEKRMDREGERAYVASVQRLKQALEDLIAGGGLVPVSRLPPLRPSAAPEAAGEPGEVVVYVVARVPTPSTPEDIEKIGKSRGKREEFVTIDVHNVSQVATRSVPVVLNLVVSQIEIGQKNLNLGQVEVGEKQRRAIVVRNASPLPLLFEVSKDIGIGSTQLRIEGARDEKTLLCARPFAGRNIEVTLVPAYPGRFHETLTFRNILDEKDVKAMVIKADVSKPSTFEVKPPVADLGACYTGPRETLGMLAHDHLRCFDRARARITITNIGRSRRDFTLVPSDRNFGLVGVDCRWEYEVDTVKAAAAGTKRVEEEIEKLEHKLKIYQRKRKVDKERRAIQRLEALRKSLSSGSEVPADDGWESSGVSESDDEGRRGRVADPDRDSSGACVTPPVAPGGVVFVTVVVHVRQQGDCFPGQQQGECELAVCEARDKEAKQSVRLRLLVTDDKKVVAAMAASASPAKVAPGKEGDSEEGAGADSRRAEPAPEGVPLRGPSPLPGASGQPASPTKAAELPPALAAATGSPEGGLRPRKRASPLPAATIPPALPDDADIAPLVAKPVTPAPQRAQGREAPKDGTEAAAPAAKTGGVLVVEPSVIDFGDVAIGEEQVQRLTVTAPSAACKFVIMPDSDAKGRSGRIGGDEDVPDAQIQFNPLTGECQRGHSISVRVKVIPAGPRLQKYRWMVKNLTNAGDRAQFVSISLLGTAPDPIAPFPSKLDFGTVYLPTQSTAYGPHDCRPAAQKELRLRNRTAQSLAVRLATTIPGQCRLLQRDEKGIHADETVHIPPEQTAALWVALWPRLETSRMLSGDVAQIVGGVLLSCGTWSGEIPFSATVGCAVLCVSGGPVVDLGARSREADRRLAPACGAFRLHNTNHVLELEYAVIVGEDSAVRLSASPQGRLGPGGTEDIPFNVTPKSFGLVQETVEFRNKSSSQAPIKRVVMLFVNDKCVTTDIPPSATGETVVSLPSILPIQPRAQELSSSGPGSPASVHTDHWAMQQGAMAASRSCQFVFSGNIGPDTRCHFTLHNKSGSHLGLLPKTDLHGYDVSGRWVPCLSVVPGPREGSRADQSAGRFQYGGAMGFRGSSRGGAAQWADCGQRLMLRRDAALSVGVKVSCVPDMRQLPPRQLRRLQEHRVVTIPCHLIFFLSEAQYPQQYSAQHRHTLTQNRAVLCIHMKLRFCVPFVRFREPAINLGRMRRTDRAPFTCELLNVSEVPLHCTITTGPTVVWGQCTATTPELCRFAEVPASASPIRPSFLPQRHRVGGVAGSPAAPPTATGGARCVTLDHEAAGQQQQRGPPIPIPPKGSVRIHASLSPGQQEAEKEVAQSETVCDGEMLLSNLLNAANRQTLHVRASLASNIWSIEAAWSADAEGTRALTLSSAIRLRPEGGGGQGSGVKPADCTLTVRCLAQLAEGATVTARLRVDTLVDVSPFLTLSVLLLASSLPVQEFTYSRDDSAVGLRVRCTPVADSRIPPVLAERLWQALVERAVADATPAAGASATAEVHIQNHSATSDVSAGELRCEVASPLELLSHGSVMRLRDMDRRESEALHLGYLYIAADNQPDEVVQVWGAIAQEDTFALSEPALVLRPASAAAAASAGDDALLTYTGVFSVRSLFELGPPLRLQLHAYQRTPEGGQQPHAASVHFSPAAPEVQPGASVDVAVTVQARAAQDLADALVVFIQDLDCRFSFQVTSVAVASPYDEEHSAHFESSVHHSRAHFDPSVLAHDSSVRSGNLDSGEATPAVPVRSESPISTASDAPHTNSEGVQSPAIERPQVPPADLAPRDTEPLDEAPAPAPQQRHAKQQGPAAAPGTLKDEELSFRLHNCKAVDGSASCGRHYVLALPPASVDSGKVQHRLLIENTSNVAVEVDVTVLRLPQEPEWLTAVKDSIKVPPQDRAPLVLTALAKSLGHYSTYVMLQRRSAPADLVMLRCAMEVVGGGSAASGFFDILVDGKAPDAKGKATHTHLVDFGEVFYQEQVVHRCVDVVNQSPHRLDFTLTHTNRRTTPPEVNVDVRLSLALRSLKGFHRLTVEPHKTVRVYIWYQVVVVSEDKVAQHPPDQFELFSDVVLKCRMIKDIQKTLVLRACCLRPQISVSTSTLEFRDGGPAAVPLTLTNMWDEPAQVVVRQDIAMAFRVSAPGCGGLADPIGVPPRGTYELSVSPNATQLEALRRRVAAHHQSPLGVEEHFTVYNRRFPKEKKRVVLRYALSGPASDSSFRTLDMAECFARLEEMIIAFLRRFCVFAHASEQALTPVWAAAQGLLAADDESEEDDGTQSGLATPETPAEGQREVCRRRNSTSRAGARRAMVHQLAGEYEAVFASQEANRLYFEFRHLTDELVYQGLRGKGGMFFDLARLLYSGVLRRRMFSHPLLEADSLPRAVREWRGQARYFDGYSSCFGAELGQL